MVLHTHTLLRLETQHLVRKTVGEVGGGPVHASHALYMGRPSTWRARGSMKFVKVSGRKAREFGEWGGQRTVKKGGGAVRMRGKDIGGRSS